MVASQAVNFADIFDTAFRGGLAGPVPHRIELTRPSGPSTAGGKQILQHIRLVPSSGGPSTVMGSVNGVEARVELRSYNYLAENHRRRFKGAQIPIDANAYTAIVRAMETFFMVQRFQTLVVDEVPASSDDEMDEDAEAQGTGFAFTAAVIGGVIVLVALMVGVLLMLKK